MQLQSVPHVWLLPQHQLLLPELHCCCPVAQPPTGNEHVFCDGKTPLDSVAIWVANLAFEPERDIEATCGGRFMVHLLSEKAVDAVKMEQLGVLGKILRSI
jgi:hypothetical protein